LKVRKPNFHPARAQTPAILYQEVERFYAKHGFIPSSGDPLHLFFPLDPLRK
jgi:hypothetical protein